MILLALEDGARSVQLLHENEPHHVVGERHARQRYLVVGTLVDCLGETVRAAYHQHEVAPRGLPLAEPLGEVDASPLFATLIEKHQAVLR